MIVEKKALLKDHYYHKLEYFDSARQAFEKVLQKLKSEKVTIFLPAYIGWSSREGSGIYDPVISTKVNHVFYALDKELNINLDYLEYLLKKESGKKAVLLVDYFGFIDKEYELAIQLIRKYKALIIEDAAHAFFTDYVDGKCGKKTDFVLYSLHKLFPFSKGGMVKINHRSFDDIFTSKKKIYENPFEYNLKSIAEQRKKNALEIQKQLSGYKGIRLIRPVEKYGDCTPQTVPVIVQEHDKSDLYFKMNELGYGVVSLYHTMIEPIQKDFPQSVEIGNKILNLPVHQDIGTSEIKRMCDLLKQLCKQETFN